MSWYKVDDFVMKCLLWWAWMCLLGIVLWCFGALRVFGSALMLVGMIGGALGAVYFLVRMTIDVIRGDEFE